MADGDNSIMGRTFRWTFGDGPTEGKTYEHVFSNDGTVVFNDVTPAQGDEAKQDRAGADKSAEKSNGDESTAAKSGTKYASFEVAPGIHLVSYLSADSGYTLTTCMDLNTKRLHGFASSSKEWYPLTGTVEVVT